MHTSKTIPFYLITPSSTTSTPHPNPTLPTSQLHHPNFITPTLRPSITSPSPQHSSFHLPHTSKPPIKPLIILNHLTENFSLPKSTKFNQFSPRFLAHPTFQPKNLQLTHNQPLNSKLTNFSALLIQRPLYFNFLHSKTEFYTVIYKPRASFHPPKLQFPRKFYWHLSPSLPNTMAKSSKIMPQNTLFNTFLLLALLPALSVFSIYFYACFYGNKLSMSMEKEFYQLSATISCYPPLDFLNDKMLLQKVWEKRTTRVTKRVTKKC